MVDFRVDDGFHAHPKTFGITLNAAGLWVLAGSWCARYLTDGYIPGDVLRNFAGRQTSTIQELVNRNLLLPMGDGYQFVDWLDYQRSKDDIDAERERWRIRQARARRKRWGPDEDPKP